MIRATVFSILIKCAFFKELLYREHAIYSIYFLFLSGQRPASITRIERDTSSSVAQSVRANILCKSLNREMK